MKRVEFKVIYYIQWNVSNLERRRILNFSTDISPVKLYDSLGNGDIFIFFRIFPLFLSTLEMHQPRKPCNSGRNQKLSTRGKSTSARILGFQTWISDDRLADSNCWSNELSTKRNSSMPLFNRKILERMHYFLKH